MRRPVCESRYVFELSSCPTRKIPRSAEVELRRALAGFEKKLGEEHARTHEAMAHLARLLTAKGELGAVTLYKRVLAAQECTLGRVRRSPALSHEKFESSSSRIRPEGLIPAW